ncbi:MAG: metallophosphoesterase [Oscillospiraceae bacterium]|nr:metallophosphoesterase [Oscillospiraceae bacterium]
MVVFLFLLVASCKSGTTPSETTPEPTVTPSDSSTDTAPSPLLSPSPIPSSEPSDPSGDYPVYTLTILHTNDWHGVLDRVPQYATLVKEIRAETDNVLLLDAGDIFRRGMYEEYFGEVEIKIMNAMGYDALTFGNNDYPQKDKEMPDFPRHPILLTAEFPILCANVTIDGEVLDGFEPYIVVTVGGLDIAVIGVTSMKPHNNGSDISKKADFTSPELVVEQMLAEVKPVSDIQIVLSHAGIDKDREMRGVSAVVGGDNHMVLYTPAVILDDDKSIPIVQAGGEENHFLGRLDLTFEEIDGVWVLHSFHGRLLSIVDTPPDPEIEAIIEHYLSELELAA